MISMVVISTRISAWDFISDKDLPDFTVDCIASNRAGVASVNYRIRANTPKLATV